MELSVYNLVIGNLARSAAAIGGLYASLHSEIQHQTDHYILEKADELTGNRLKRTHIESYLEENRQYLANSYQGLAVVQTAQQQTARIREKLEQMEVLAEKAGSGSYTQEQIEAFQEAFQTHLYEMDQIAIGTHPGGFMMLSFTGFGTVGVEVEREQKVEIDSMDMTATGLGILDSMDLTGAPEEALAAVQAALEEIASYSGHLEETKDALETALHTLNTEREALLPALEAVSEKQSAWQALEMITGITRDSTSWLLAAQARVESDKALQLLLEQIK